MVLCMRGMGATDFGPILHVSQRPTLTHSLSVNNCLHNNCLHRSNHDQNEVNEYGILTEPFQIFSKTFLYCVCVHIYIAYIVCVYINIYVVYIHTIHTHDIYMIYIIQENFTFNIHKGKFAPGPNYPVHTAL